VESVIEQSLVLRELIEEGEVGLIGGSYSVDSGEVDFYEDTYMCGEIKHFYLDVPHKHP
jgi:carbonic anhydrase